MSEEPRRPAFSLRQVFHPTDRAAREQEAFAHALKLTCLAQADLTIMHVGPEDFDDFPRVRPMLQKWGLLPEGSTKEDVTKLGVHISKFRAVADHAAAAILRQLTLQPADLLVMSTHQREGLARLTHEAVAEPVARGAHVKTLFVPAGVAGFVSAQTGITKLERILIPVTRHPDPQPAIDAATDLAGALGAEKVLFELVYLGDEATFPKINKPTQPGWRWERLIAKGNAVDWIVAAGQDFDVDLIVMTTAGHQSVIDMLRGSTTERVLRAVRSPLLAIPE
ncbi:MAG: universal stress protein [Nitrospira sp.]|nr:universal stress protein [Nitrospira sp.]